MGFNCGIVGLPNVGKSTLFNALTQTVSAQAANYPFCTIEPNVGRIAVPDSRLEILSKFAGSKSIIPTSLEFVDIAGLVKGASKGEGLGNQFLGHIRSTNTIIHVLRCFEDENITHVEGTVDPLRDLSLIETELLLADLDSLNKQVISIEKKAKTGDKESKYKFDAFNQLLPYLEDGVVVRDVAHKFEDPSIFDQFITSKPILYVCNIESEGFNEHVEAVKNHAGDDNVISICASLESEIATIQDPLERLEFLKAMGLNQSGLDTLIQKGYKLLNLMTFFTIGPKEARAWTIKRGCKAPQAAGVIHSDFERGFICAEVIGYNDYVELGGESGAKSHGKARIEGRDYTMNDADVVHFRFNV